MADCCNDFTRSHLVRASVARAGAGLPVIEPGMPTPAGTGLTRRSMLLRSAGMALAVYGAGRTLTPEAFEAAVAEAAGEQKVLISIFMDGGADALSLLAPVNDARYIALRPLLRMLPGAGPTFAGDTRLQLAPVRPGPARAVGRPRLRRRRRPGDRLRLAQPVALHLAPLLGGRRDEPDGVDGLARALPRPRRPSRRADPGASRWTTPCRRSWRRATSPSPRRATSATTGSPRRASGARWRRACATTYGTLGTLASGDPIMAQARQAQANSAGLARDLASVGAGTPPDGANYPAAASDFKDRLQGIARMLATVDGSGNHLPVRAITLNAAGGYDTHSNQATDFSNSLLATGVEPARLLARPRAARPRPTASSSRCGASSAAGPPRTARAPTTARRARRSSSARTSSRA